MTSPRPELPNDLTSCHVLIEQLRGQLHEAAAQIGELKLSVEAGGGQISQLESQLAEHRETIETQQEMIDMLTADNKLLKRSLFGSRRERFEDDPDQATLFDLKSLDPVEEPNDKDPEKRRKKKRTSKGRRRRVFPEFLPREEERHYLKEEDIPEELRNHPGARRFFKKVGEQIELIPMQLKVVEQLQEVLVVDQPDETSRIISASRPRSLIQSFAGCSVLAYLTVGRFADHLPYYRLENILGRSGLHIDRSTQWRWMHRLAAGVTPLVDLMWDRALQSQVIAMDETPVKELGGAGTTLTGYLWTGVGDMDHPYDCFFYTSDRRGIRPETFLTRYRGYLMADAYIAYERIGELMPNIIKASCWAHGRRKFEECHHLGATKQTRAALAYLRKLFDLEDQYRDCSAEERFAARKKCSRPIVDKFHEWLENEQTRQLPKSKLRGAINYMLHRWESFTRFLESGMVPLDNNLAERALKFPILGRKAWLFVGNHKAGETAAKLFTLTKTCNRLHLDPFAYLKDVYARLPTLSEAELPSLLPDRWLKDHPQHILPKRVQEAIDRALRAREQRAERRRLAA